MFGNSYLYHYINMRTLLFFVIVILTLYPPVSLYAAPHALEDEVNPKRPFAIDIFVRKEPLKYYFEDCSHPYAAQIAKSYRAWFSNVQSRLRKETDPAVEYYKEIIDFATGEEAYICTDEKDADIRFYVKNGGEYLRYGPRNSQGVFTYQNGKMIIAVRTDAMTERDGFNTLTHEIGHSLRMQDLYSGEFHATEGKYGSGPRDSIMKDARYLTCDDADAILNALYLTKKLTGANPPDLQFDSFCNYLNNPKTTYKNAMVLNRGPLVIDDKGSRTVYTYCKDGNPHQVVKISPYNYDILYETVQAPVNCDYTPLPEKKFEPNISGGYAITDFKTGKILSLNTSSSLKGRNIFMALPESGGLVLQVSTDGKIPGYIKITNEYNTAVYIMAYLEEGYNFVYDAYLEGTQRVYPTMFVYNRKDQSKHYVYGPKEKRGPSCEGEPQECEKMAELLNKTLSLVRDNSDMRLPYFGGFGPYSAKQHFQNAQSWENYLLKNFPPMSVIGKKLKAELNFPVKQLNPSDIKIKLPIK